MQNLHDTIVRLKVVLLTIVLLVIALAGYGVTKSSVAWYYQAINIVSIGLIPSCLIGLLWELFIKREFVRYLVAELPTKSRFDKFGILRAFAKRDEIDLVAYINNASSRIWIQVTSLAFLVQLPGLHEALAAKANSTGKHKVDVCVLGLSADAALAEKRGSFTEKYKDLQRDIDHHKTLLRGVPVRFYDQIPTCALFIIDDHLIVSPLLHHKRGREGIHFLAVKKNLRGEEALFFKEYEEHFKALYRVGINSDTANGKHKCESVD